MRNNFINNQSAAQTVGLVLLFAFAFVFSNRIAFAAQQEDDLSKPKISIHTDRSSVQIADPFEVVIQVLANDQASVKFPTMPQQLGVFDVIDHRDLLRIPSKTNSGMNKWTRRLTLETLETGELQIPSISFAVRTEGKPPLQVATDPLVIEVASVLEPTADPAEFADIHDLIDVPEPKTWSYTWILWSAGGGLGLAALIAGAVFVFRGRTNWTTPADWAVGEISGLTSDSNQAFGQLEHIVRTFIEEEFHVPATSYSPLELQRTISQRGASQSTSQQLADFLTKAEQAKYAGLDVPDTQFNSAKESTLQIIKSLDSIPEDTSLRNNVTTTNAEVV